MSTYKHLPTWISGKWSITDFRDSLISTLKADDSCTMLAMYFYAVTQSGWDQVRQPVLRWKEGAEDRRVLLFVGTDHGITDPSALRQICDDGVDVHLMLEYHGVFHPKVVWLRGVKEHKIWVGSNNLTRDGLLNNVEFAVVVTAQKIPMSLGRWSKSIESASVVLTQNLLKSYERQRRKFETQRAKSGATTFTWEKKIEPQEQPKVPELNAERLIVEVMPKETGGDGRQLQLPVKAVSKFFGVRSIGDTRIVKLSSKDGSPSRTFTMTMFRNNTVRIVISDLDYRDRPCVIVFRKLSNDGFEYEIVPYSIFPRRYRSLLTLCKERTRRRSRRWGFA